MTRYSGVLSSGADWRARIVPKGHGGSIELHSSDEGTTFEVQLERGLPEPREATVH